ncbi:MAG: hypothetical protein FWD06_04060 [Oscillospiraceae bacterium]|nr:hypothetical protein [Oscillospiraceae bacterium]
MNDNRNLPPPLRDRMDQTAQQAQTVQRRWNLDDFDSLLGELGVETSAKPKQAPAPPPVPPVREPLAAPSTPQVPRQNKAEEPPQPIALPVIPPAVPPRIKRVVVPEPPKPVAAPEPVAVPKPVLTPVEEVAAPPQTPPLEFTTLLDFSRDEFATAEITPEEIMTGMQAPEELTLQATGSVDPQEISPQDIVPIGAQEMFEAMEGFRLNLPPKGSRDAYTRVLEPVEKHGMLVQRDGMQATQDLSPVPRLLPATDLLQRQRVPVEEVDEDIPEGQQRLPNFSPEPPRQFAQDEADDQVAQNRQVITNQFKMKPLPKKSKTTQLPKLPQDLQTEQDKPQLDVGTPRYEYKNAYMRNDVFSALLRTRAKRTTAMLAMIAAALLAILLQVGGLWLGTDTPQYLGPMAFFFVMGLAVCAADLGRGLLGLIKARPNADTLLLLAALLCTAQVVLLFLPVEEEILRGSHMVPLFLVGAAGHAMAKFMQARQRCDNFRFCTFTAAKHLHAMHLDGKGATPERAAKQNLSGSKTALSLSTDMPEQFVAQSHRETAIDRLCRWYAPFALGLAALLGIVVTVQTGEFSLESASLGMAAAAAAMCLCLPGFALLAQATVWRTSTKSTSNNGAVVLNMQAAEDAAKTAAAVLSSGSMFVTAQSRIHGMQSLNQMREDDLMLYTVGIAMKAGGPLRAVFEGVIDGDSSVLPEIRSLTYEDRMGFSCRIHNQPVFFGNRKLLENHGVPVPVSEHEEKQRERDGRRVIYLAVDKQAVAYFVISYTPDEKLQDPLQQLEEADVEILLCNSDPCITGEELEARFGLQQGTISVLRNNFAAPYRKIMRGKAPVGHSGIYHAGGTRAFLRTIAVCMNLVKSGKRLRILLLLSALAANVLLAVIALAGQLDGVFNPLLLVAFNLVWAVVMHAGVKV